MLDVYSEWIEEFIDDKPEIKEYDGKGIRNKMEGLDNAFAYHKVGTSEFGYNNIMMDPLNELTIIAIAAHEAGHYWDLQKSFHQIIEGGIFYSILGLAFSILFAIWGYPFRVIFFQFVISAVALFLAIICANLPNLDDELTADDYLLRAIGPAVSLHMHVDLMKYDKEKDMHLGSYKAHQLEIALEELGIEYESNIET